jgi:peptidoglycan/xylan/chitin deacetylase (PgdA/CDA1 family)
MKKILFTILIALSMFAGSVLAQTNVPVLMYHEVVTTKDGVPPGDTVVLVTDFNNQMKWLSQNGYYTITASQLVTYMTTGVLPSCRGCKYPIVITFDDGWYNQQNALPALKQYNFKASFNIIAGFPGNSTSYMNWTNIKNLVKAGHEIGGHTMTHMFMMTLADAPTELVASKSRIESHIGRPVNVLAWPDGYFTNELLTYAESTAKYKGSESTNENWCEWSWTSLDGTPYCDWHAGNKYKDDEFLIKRIFVDGRCTLAEFANWVTQEHSSACVFATAPALLRVAVQPASTEDNDNEDDNKPRHSRDKLSHREHGED